PTATSQPTMGMGEYRGGRWHMLHHIPQSDGVEALSRESRLLQQSRHKRRLWAQFASAEDGPTPCIEPGCLPASRAGHTHEDARGTSHIQQACWLGMMGGDYAQMLFGSAPAVVSLAGIHAVFQRRVRLRYCYVIIAGIGQHQPALPAAHDR